MRWFAMAISLKVSAIFPLSPVHEPGRRTEKSPSRMACIFSRMRTISEDSSCAVAPLCPLVFDLRGVTSSCSGNTGVPFFLMPISLK